MRISTVSYRFVRTLRWGSILTLLAIVGIGCSNDTQNAGSQSSDGTDSSSSSSAKTVVKQELTQVKMPDPEAEKILDHEKWYTDFEKASAAAQKEDKDLFIEFTGSDWCPPCIRLHETILRYKNFTDYAKQRFVLLKLDFPRGGNQSAEERAKNDAMANKYGIESFPSILLTDAKGRVYSRLGFQPLSIPEFAKLLDEQVKIRLNRDFLLATADTLEGVEKAQKLEEAVLSVGKDFTLPSYKEQLAQIVELDNENKAGLKKKYEERLTQFEFSQQNFELQSKLEKIDSYEEKLSEIDKLEKEFPDYKRGHLELNMLRAYVQNEAKQVDALVATTDKLFADKELLENIKIQLRLWRIESFIDTKRWADAGKELDTVKDSYPDETELQINVLLFRAKIAAEQGQKDDARKFIAAAKKEIKDPRVRVQIDGYAEELLADDEPEKATEDKSQDKPNSNDDDSKEETKSDAAESKPDQSSNASSSSKKTDADDAPK